MFTEQKFISAEIKTIINKDDLIPLFLYTGVYNYQAVNSHLVTLKQYLSSHISKKKTIKDSYNILVECLENINKHGFSFKKDDETDSIYGYVIFASEPTRYSVWVGNFIAEKDFVILKKMFDEIITANNEELRELYRTKLINNELSEKQGMGVGIIDVLLKSKETINFTSKKFNNDTYFFSLEITIQN
ncbi:MAG: hypothetical protein H7141_03470 [Burkholderiales bacterium]|nr:hypothetical protein [Bacteroidia bacterium]